MKNLTVGLAALMVCAVVSGCFIRGVRRSANGDPLPPGRPDQPVQMAYSALEREEENKLMPSGLNHTVLIDEAKLMVGAQESCAELTIRTPVGFDEPLQMRDVSCDWDWIGHTASVRSSSEPVTTEYPFVGEAPRINFSGPTSWLSVPIGPGQPMKFVMVERKATVCCPGYPALDAQINIRSQHGFRDFALKFVWVLSQPPSAATPGQANASPSSAM